MKLGLVPLVGHKGFAACAKISADTSPLALAAEALRLLAGRPIDSPRPPLRELLVVPQLHRLKEDDRGTQSGLAAFVPHRPVHTEPMSKQQD